MDDFCILYTNNNKFNRLYLKILILLKIKEYIKNKELKENKKEENKKEENKKEEKIVEIEMIGNKIDEICVVNLEDTKKVDNKENGKLTPLNLEDNNIKEDNIEENGVKDIDVGCCIFCNGLKKLILYLCKKIKKYYIKIKFIK